ncbi:hypothetical protein [Xenorhabdus sp. IM139775]|uniref:hypothetical protein n=1 Tax=Xenorhabdus sp. IM139775 TaxID=3025876 RepID=UPI00235822E9|nr:hypothetical protein [Xenorhabdus sp. IM139775]MDC9592765.1 hypothetical protein [Xenorhabdus sp. IM139775]
MDLLNDKWVPVNNNGVITHMAIDEIHNLPLSALAFSRFDFYYAFLLLLIGLTHYKSKTYPVLGDSERFMQNIRATNGKQKPISVLLLDAPSENAVKNNTDHFAKRGLCSQMCIPCATIALYAKTQFESAGGVGLRPGLFYNTVSYFIEKKLSEKR